jgi:2-aminoethylphosphonate dioxygenase
MVGSNFLKRQFNRDGYIVLKNVFTKKQTDIIVSEAKKLYELPQIKGGYMKYYEDNSFNCNINKNKILARIENFIHDPNLSSLKNVVNTEVTPIVEEMLESRVSLFKDKINWKFPGGGAFKPHQDYDAWADLSPKTFVTAAIFVDECTVENGCLEMVRGKHKEGIFKNDFGQLDKDLVYSMEWQTILGASSDLILFDSYVPHRSDVNKSDNSRRVYYFTYNLMSEGDYYDAYFEKKRFEFPPDFERDQNTNINLNSKYNLANPIK